MSGIHISSEGLQGKIDHLLREVVIEAIDGDDRLCDFGSNGDGSSLVLEFEVDKLQQVGVFQLVADE